MEDETKALPEEQAAESERPVVLGYQSPQRRAHGVASSIDLLAGTIATVFGVLSVLLLIGTLSSVISVPGQLLDEDRMRYAAIAGLLIFGAAASIRSAWYYFGGWTQTSDHGKRVRRIILPWNWY